MVKISSIIEIANYLHISFSGSYEHLKKIDELSNTILQASQDHQCANLLLDFSEAIGMDEITIIEEHELGEFIRKVLTHSFRIAMLFPELSNDPAFMIGKHLENVAVNRGVELRVFWQRDDAVTWISKVDDDSKEDSNNG